MVNHQFQYLKRSEGENKIMSEKKFDREYPVTFIREKQFLDHCGIRYEFVKSINGITTFKYKKTPFLFECLSVFYKQFTNNENNNVNE